MKIYAQVIGINIQINKTNLKPKKQKNMNSSDLIWKELLQELNNELL